MTYFYNYTENKRFSNNSNDFFMNIKTLPDELEEIVYSYIPKSATIFITKQNYLTYHYLVRSLVNRKHIENYIRSMVRQDNDFVFKLLLVENYNRWLNMKKYYYQECIFNNYLMFLETYAIDNQSIKCIKLLSDLFEEEGLSKNRHKKNTNRYIRWKP
jgi:hypothetical protein